jgi:hypothetical protein
MKTRSNLVTERAGVNFVRSAVEGTGCLFKDINLQHDFGQDATILLVVNGQVRPREVALQIKSGKSYISSDACNLPATAAHVYLWAEHDLITIGVIYDPEEAAAWWIDLQTAARNFRKSSPKSGTTFTFAKGLWNQFNKEDFAAIVIPTLLGEAPNVPIARLCTWVLSDDMTAHEIGVRAIRARHYRELTGWNCLIDAFISRSPDQLTIHLPITLAMLLGHDDLGFYSDQIPRDIRASAVSRVLAFGPNEIAKLLSMLPDTDFERPSLGYSLLPLLGQTGQSSHILCAIRDNGEFGPAVRQLAGQLFQWHRREPNWWTFWRRDAEPKD